MSRGKHLRGILRNCRAGGPPAAFLVERASRPFPNHPACRSVSLSLHSMAMKADGDVLITLEKLSKPFVMNPVETSPDETDLCNDHPKIQILTIEGQIIVSD